MEGARDVPRPVTQVLDEAKACVYGIKVAEYGSYTECFHRIAEMWSVVKGVKFTAEDVALMMIAFKVAREVGKHKHDNLVDICGYAELLELLTHNDM